MAWEQLALALIVEAIAVARGRQAVRLPVFPGFQASASHLVAGILVISSMMQPARVHAGPPSIPVSTEATPNSGTPPSRPTVPGPDAHDRPIARCLEPASPVPAVDAPTRTVHTPHNNLTIHKTTP